MKREPTRAWIPGILVLLGAALPLGAAPAVAVTARDDDHTRVVNDQSQIFDRLESLKTMMERLADKLEAQDRNYKAGLLRRAVGE